jgi:hypothetical protein
MMFLCVSQQVSKRSSKTLKKSCQKRGAGGGGGGGASRGFFLDFVIAFLAVSLHEELKNTIKIFSKIKPETSKTIGALILFFSAPCSGSRRNHQNLDQNYQKISPKKSRAGRR